MTAQPWAIEAKKVSKAFGRKSVLENLDLSLPEGACVGLLGINGAGKTTMLKNLLGFLPVDNGEIRLFGESASVLSEALRARIGYVPQASELFMWLTGGAMLKFIAAFYPAFDWNYVEGLIERWQVSLKTPIASLSPGQRQRLSIVRALASRPQVLVLDEPIASLDPVTRIAVIDHLLEERRSRQITILFSSHIIGDLERLCTHFAVLSQGRITTFETTEQLREKAAQTHSGDLEAMLCAWL